MVEENQLKMISFQSIILIQLVLTALAEEFPLNFNPHSPEHVAAHIFLYGNGSVPIAEGPNPFANNALNGTEFMIKHQKWSKEMVELQRKNALTFWREKYSLDGEELMKEGKGAVIQYQISPAVNGRAYMMNTPCPTPPEGHEVVDGGFQLFVTDPNGVEVIDANTGDKIFYAFQTNLVYSWMRIHVREADDNCGVVEPPPEWIVLRYQSKGLAKWTTDAIMFELEFIGENYFGSGQSLGMSAPILSESEITNRLLNYVTFNSTGPEAMFDHSPVNRVNDKEGERDHTKQDMVTPNKDTKIGAEIKLPKGGKKNMFLEAVKDEKAGHETSKKQSSANQRFIWFL